MAPCGILWTALFVCYATSSVQAAPEGERTSTFWGDDVGNRGEIERMMQEMSHLKTAYSKCVKDATNAKIQHAMALMEVPRQSDASATCDDAESEARDQLLAAVAEIQTMLNWMKSQHVFQPVNLAHDRHARQSSIKYEAGPKRAVDGDANTDFFTRTCSYTRTQDDPWWYVDLEREYAIGEVKVFNCDRYAERINPFNLHVGNSTDVEENEKCGGDYGAEYEETLMFIVNCAGKFGRYVGIRLPGPDRELYLCEVRVYEYFTLDESRK